MEARVSTEADDTLHFVLLLLLSYFFGLLLLLLLNVTLRLLFVMVLALKWITH